MPELTPEHRARMAVARASKGPVSTRGAEKLIQEAHLGDLPPDTLSAIKKRLSEMLSSCRLRYLRAMAGGGPKAGITAFCQMCLGWDDYREGIRACTDPACPLYPYRPYQRRRRAM